MAASRQDLRRGGHRSVGGAGPRLAYGAGWRPEREERLKCVCWRDAFASSKSDCCLRLKRQSRGGFTRSFSVYGGLAQQGWAYLSRRKFPPRRIAAAHKRPALLTILAFCMPSGAKWAALLGALRRRAGFAALPERSKISQKTASEQSTTRPSPSAG